jgi:hypothetical protein
MKALRRAVAVAAIAVPLSCVARDLDAEALARAIGDLKSNAQEARLFLEALRDDQLTNQYARVHREELADQLRDAMKPLERRAPESLAPKAARASALGERMKAALEGLNGHIGERDAAGKAATDVEAAARDLDALAKGRS